VCVPRPNKPINPGNSNADAPPSRSHVWTKYGAPGGAGSFSPETADVEITVEDITVIQSESDEAVSKYHERGSAAHIDYDSDYVPTPVFEVEKRWTVVRSIDGRSYTRVDEAVFVEIKPEIEPL